MTQNHTLGIETHWLLGFGLQILLQFGCFGRSLLLSITCHDVRVTWMSLIQRSCDLLGCLLSRSVRFLSRKEERRRWSDKGVLWEKVRFKKVRFAWFESQKQWWMIKVFKETWINNCYVSCKKVSSYFSSSMWILRFHFYLQLKCKYANNNGTFKNFIPKQWPRTKPQHTTPNCRWLSPYFYRHPYIQQLRFYPRNEKEVEAAACKWCLGFVRGVVLGARGLERGSKGTRQEEWRG